MEPVDPQALGHPLVAVLGRVGASLRDATQVSILGLDAVTAAASMRQLAALESQLGAVRLTVLATPTPSMSPDPRGRRRPRPGWRTRSR